MPLHSLTVSLMLSTGPIGRPGRLRLALRVAGAVGFPAGGSVVADGAAPRDVDFTDAEFRGLLRLAEDVGILERDPRVEAVADTSDTSNALLIRLAHEAGARAVELPMMCSGYDGPDAAALRRVCAALLAKAEVRDDVLWFYLAGRSPS
jgi:hypothetical protein